ncbi:hypothetical protein AGLY_016142 [Aphis glycines]|uniref:Uncharacterized protein n=1 Tax=Aphis glycines TaxID=307491 RepID=A0A6G0SYW4_APHGL|nr:hypothetical protein AGLY_016142 [Aphis glycines]
MDCSFKTSNYEYTLNHYILTDVIDTSHFINFSFKLNRLFDFVSAVYHLRWLIAFLFLLDHPLFEEIVILPPLSLQFIWSVEDSEATLPPPPTLQRLYNLHINLSTLSVLFNLFIDQTQPREMLKETFLYSSCSLVKYLMKKALIIIEYECSKKMIKAKTYEHKQLYQWIVETLQTRIYNNSSFGNDVRPFRFVYIKTKDSVGKRYLVFGGKWLWPLISISYIMENEYIVIMTVGRSDVRKILNIILDILNLDLITFILLDIGQIVILVAYPFHLFIQFRSKYEIDYTKINIYSYTSVVTKKLGQTFKYLVLNLHPNSQNIFDSVQQENKEMVMFLENLQYFLLVHKVINKSLLPFMSMKYGNMADNWSRSNKSMLPVETATLKQLNGIGDTQRNVHKYNILEWWPIRMTRVLIPRKISMHTLPYGNIPFLYYPTPQKYNFIFKFIDTLIDYRVIRVKLINFTVVPSLVFNNDNIDNI